MKRVPAGVDGVPGACAAFVKVAPVAWVYTAVLAACSAGILAGGVLLTRRLFREELFAHGGEEPLDGPRGAAGEGAEGAR